jgi:hypothetical protein
MNGKATVPHKINAWVGRENASLSRDEGIAVFNVTERVLPDMRVDISANTA